MLFRSTKLQEYIVNEISNKFGEKYVDKTLETNKCPRCGGMLGQLLLGFSDPRKYAKMIQCDNCKLSPYKVQVGRYIDVADSFHIYGHKLKEFENRFINSALKQPCERRFWDLSSPEMKEMVKEGEEKAYKLVKSLDEKNGKTNLPSVNQSI